MEKRREELTELKSYTEGIDNELTMILQSLQWDRKHLLQNPVMVTCRYDSNHKVPPDKTEEHEKECFLRQNEYTKDDQLLPDPVDSKSNTLIKLSKEDIEQIIGNATRSDPLLKKGVGCRGAEPMSLERLQRSYSADERRAIHDAVVSAVPSCHDLTDLALLSGGDDQKSKVILSRMEILVELRNMRRRRTKYRVAAKSRNYSDVLRDVIKTQMEHYNDGQSENTPKETADEQNHETDKHNDSRQSRQASKDDDRYRYERRRKVISRPAIEIKTEKEDSIERNRAYSRETSDRVYRYKEGRRDSRDRERDRNRHDERSKEQKNDAKSHKYPEQSRKRRHDEDSEKDYKYNERTRETKFEKSKERNKHVDKEYNAEKRSYKHRDVDRVYQVKQEPGLDDDRNNRHRERRGEENKDKHYKQKDRTERKYDENRRRDRGRSSERRQDHRYEERSSERIYIKQEREDNATRQDTSYYEKDKSKDRRRKSNDRRNDRSYGRNSYSAETTVTQETYDRYYDRPSEEVYDPNKKIKVEK